MEDNQLNHNLNEDQNAQPYVQNAEESDSIFSGSKSIWETANEEIAKEMSDKDIPNKDISQKNDKTEEKIIIKKKVDKNENNDLTPKDDEPYLKENNNLKTRLHDGQKYITSLNKGRQKAISHLAELLENGDISEENHKLLVSSLAVDGAKAPEGLEKDDYSTPFVKFRELFSGASNEIENYKNATDMTDEEMGNRIQAFNTYIRDLTPQEEEELYDELVPYANNQMALLKRMIKKGEQFIENGYGEFIKAGGLRKYLKYTSNEMSIMRKKIDKLEKEKLEYKGGITQNFRMEEALPSGKKDIVDPGEQFFYIRDNWSKFSGK